MYAGEQRRNAKDWEMFKDEIARTWGMKKVTVIPVVEGALDATSTDFAKCDAAVGVDMKI